MKPIINGVLASIAVLGLVASCSDDKKASSPDSSGGATGTSLAPGETSAANGGTVGTINLPPGVTLPAGMITLPPGVTLPTLPPGLTIPPGGTFPSSMSIPTQVIDLMIAQLEAAGMNVDRACVEALLNDPDFRNMIMSGSTPSGDMIQSLVSCLRA